LTVTHRVLSVDIPFNKSEMVKQSSLRYLPNKGGNQEEPQSFRTGRKSDKGNGEKQ
jgi:hypothetical protein